MQWLKLIKRSIPHNWKVGLQATRRWIRDYWSGDLQRFATRSKSIEVGNWQTRIQVEQELKPSAYSENKRHNLTIAVHQIESVVIQPNQIFSFWSVVGQPTKRRGYLEGRALMNDQLQAVVGGGLCQLSGLIYLLALQTDLEILERHSHSQDIYTDETRFAPLGSDATVVYGYKDLRIQNRTTSPLRFQFEIQPNSITASILAIRSIPKYSVEFLLDDRHSDKWVQTLRYLSPSQAPQVVQQTVYAR
ncbi:VanW family protein [Alkalinema pantanalense CENA528]|uniref:VanW family protein n=1 Tax=Alkalinema pantanalense TaxID=1620705 RepID=UPI003D6F830E